ncbi:hypothetical protein L211DRAFT_664238 [Terfezia boudieri ATCC MYA-4762]|uniref:DUF7580 domain-containing protein n=1 Tax=Terfezia boudieri ATCC MYA-4762 TaxID=1051890 RepID=A0A3N4L8E4_9PEZI|nr:hypothetical protein L211DRAFT_664238 [Terfezia boudieri ATCC MYA-4762]
MADIAGLVFGAFPLAIEGIKAYGGGMQTFKDMKHYRQILSQFSRELNVERCKYDNTFLGLLTELVGPAKADRMKNDLKSAEWNDKDFRSRLKLRIGLAEETLDNLLYVAEQLNETLRTVCEKFKLSPEKNKKKLTRRRHEFDPFLAWDVGMLGKFRTEQIGLIRQRNEDLVLLANGGQRPASGFGAGPFNSPRISDTLIEYHQGVQRRARVLYAIMGERLLPPTCKCGAPHGAHLELKLRSSPPMKAPSKSQAVGPDRFFTFSLVFSTQNNGHQLTEMWQGFHLEPIEDRSRRKTQVPLAMSPSSSSSSQPTTKPVSEGGRSIPPDQFRIPSFRDSRWWKAKLGRGLPGPNKLYACDHRPNNLTPTNRPIPIDRPPASKLKRAMFADEDTSGEDDENDVTFTDLPTISSFCKTLATYKTVDHPPKCVGVLTSTDKHEHRVWTLLQHFPKPERFVSLADLITTYTAILDRPSCTSRLVLGLKLLSSVLQLNTTQWLTEVWEAKDILFPEASPQATDQYHPHNILSRPFVHRNFSSSGSTAASDEYPPDSQHQRANQAKAILGSNHSLYSLGIVLLEIWYWQTFDSLYKSSRSRQTELEFSLYLSTKLSEEAGVEYARAVQGCIRGFQMRETDLDDNSFRRKVYQDVWGLLEANLRTFSKCDSIQKIIGDE